MMKNWTIENLERNSFIPINWNGRGFHDWISDINKAHKMTKDDAMHIIRQYPAFNLCARQID